MSPKKAQAGSLLAFREVARQVPDSTLDLFGGGPMLDFQKQLSRFLGIEDRVTFHGIADHKRVVDRLREARCYIHPSVVADDGDSEGTPVSVLEGMAMGLPVAATRHGGIRDVVRDGETGALVEEYDVESLAEAMVRYALDPDLAANHGRAGRDDVAKRWAMTHSLDRLAKILSEAMA
jgi:glycosyltransferase involved in cell wall biosynthesis